MHPGHVDPAQQAMHPVSSHLTASKCSNPRSSQFQQFSNSRGPEEAVLSARLNSVQQGLDQHGITSFCEVKMFISSKELS